MPRKPIIPPTNKTPDEIAQDLLKPRPPRK